MDQELLFNRPPSPSLDALTMKYLHPLDALPADTSSSDAASQTSEESPRDWSGGLPPSWSDVKSEDPWQWMDLDKMAGGSAGLSSLSSTGAPSTAAQNAFATHGIIDPMILNFDDAFLSQQSQAITQQSLFPSSASPMDILGLPGLLPSLHSSLAHQHFNFNTAGLQQHLANSLLQTLPQPLYPSPPTPAPSANEGDDIAARARELAGVSVAITQQQAGMFHSNGLSLPSAPAGTPTQNHLAVPTNGLAPAWSPSTSSAPSPSSSSSEANPPDVTVGSSGRPKTSHTTIERRYRTNLNARITALRHAVPALRILDKDQFPEDVVDARGYVDGVKAARKASKASVLGKAAEYIHVLKRRETRLRRELQGLRSLVNGLVGGPMLLNQWEKSWLERYGGEEKDEADSESDVGDEDSEDEDDKPRKKPKVAPKPVTPTVPKEKKTPSQPVNPVVPETGKRKRGRPRKNQNVISASQSADSLTTPPQHVPFITQPQQAQAPEPVVAPQQPHESSSAKYLLGVFLFFSFFKTPTDHTSSHAQHTHTGTVLSSSSTLLGSTINRASSTLPATDIKWTSAVNYLHTILSIVLILSLVLPRLPSPWSLFGLLPRRESLAEKQGSEDLQTERRNLAKALNVRGLVFESIAATWKSLKAKVSSTPANRKADTDESEVLKKQVWHRFAKVELVVGPTLSVSDRFTKALAIYNRLPTPPSWADLSTLAMVAHPFSVPFAEKLWTKAQSLAKTSTHRSAYVLKLDLPRVVELFERSVSYGLAIPTDGPADGLPVDQTAMEVVADVLMLEAIKALVGKMFIKTAKAHVPSEQGFFDHFPAHPDSIDSMFQDDAEMAASAEIVLALGKGSTGRVSDVLELWATFWRGEADDAVLAALEDAEEDEAEAEFDMKTRQPLLIKETMELMKALILLKHVLQSSTSRSSSSTLSPYRSSSMTPTASSTCLALTLQTPSPSPTLMSFPMSSTSSLPLKLRQALASSAFDEDEEIDEARDDVVDMLCNGHLATRRVRVQS